MTDKTVNTKFPILTPRPEGELNRGKYIKEGGIKKEIERGREREREREEEKEKERGREQERTREKERGQLPQTITPHTLCQTLLLHSPMVH